MRPSPLLLLIAAAGCYHSPTGSGDARPVTPPAGPAPRLAWIDNGFTADALPAVAADGAAVLVGIQAGDGGRGNPNFRLELRDRSDAKIAERVVLTADEADKLFDAGGKTAELDRRIAEANRWMAEQHAARRFIPMQQLEIEPGPEIASAFRATGTVTLEWRPSKLTITQGGRSLLDRATPGSWLPEDRPIPGEAFVCHNPAFLGGATVDVARKIALLQIGYGGTDTCWEPDAQHHVVTW